MTNDEFDDLVDAWHLGKGKPGEPFHEFAGLTHWEYADIAERSELVEQYDLVDGKMKRKTPYEITDQFCAFRCRVFDTEVVVFCRYCPGDVVKIPRPVREEGLCQAIFLFTRMHLECQNRWEVENR